MVDYSSSKGSRQNRSDDDFSFKLVEHVGTVSKYNNDWTKEVNIIEWNGREAKIDIRDWDPDHKRMRKGITLFRAEAEELVRILTRFLAKTSDSIERDELDDREMSADYGVLVDHDAVSDGVNWTDSGLSSSPDPANDTGEAA